MLTNAIEDKVITMLLKSDVNKILVGIVKLLAITILKIFKSNPFKLREIKS